MFLNMTEWKSGEIEGRSDDAHSQTTEIRTDNFHALRVQTETAPSTIGSRKIFNDFTTITKRMIKVVRGYSFNE